MTSEPNLEHWYSALGSQFGIIVDCQGADPEKVRQKLYAIRKAAADPDLECLSIAPSPTAPTKELWIYRSEKK